MGLATRDFPQVFPKAKVHLTAQLLQVMAPYTDPVAERKGAA